MSKAVSRVCAAVLLAACCALLPARAEAASVLFYDPHGRLTPLTNLFTSQFADTATVVTSNAQLLATDFSLFDIVWDGGHFNNEGAAAAQKVVDFVNAGGGFYGQTERPCCEAHNDWVEGIFKTLTGDNAMQFGGGGDSPSSSPGQFLFPDTTILLDPNDIRGTTFDISAPGFLSVSDPSKIFAKQPNGFNIGVAYATADLVNKAGRIVTISDIDWLNSFTADETKALQNIRKFLLAGESLPPGCGQNPNQPGCEPGGGGNQVPEPATFGLLAAGLALLAARRRQRS